jgi:hypothetical protein
MLFYALNAPSLAVPIGEGKASDLRFTEIERCRRVAVVPALEMD